MINKYLIKLIKKDTKYISWTVFFQWLILLTNITTIILLVLTIKDFYTNTSLNYLYIITIVIVLGIRTLLTYLQAQSSYKASANIKRTLRTNLYQKLLQMDNEYQTIGSTSEIIQVATEGIDQLEIYFGRFLPQLFYALLAPLTLFIVIGTMDLKVASVLLVFVPLIPISIILVQKIAKRIFSKYWNSYTKMGDSFLESIQALTTLKIFSVEDKYQDLLKEEAENFRTQTMRVLYMQLNSITIMDLVAYGGAAMGIYLAVQSYYNETINLYQALIIILLTADFFIPMRVLGSYFHIAMNGISASKLLANILNLETEEKEILRTKGKVLTFEDVNFSYDDASFIENLNLTLTKGVYALVGVSGSGKSTLSKLMSRRLKPTKGTIKIDGIDINHKDVSSLVRVVDYNSYLFKGSLRDNLTMADTIDDSILWGYIRQFGLDETFGSLDDNIEEGGSNLSGGQKQRVSIIRCLLHPAPIYIFDEVTTGLDSENEANIMQLIYELGKSSIVLIITHRLSNIIDCETIYVIEHGKIIGKGNHEGLLEGLPIYKNLYTTQSQQEMIQEVEA